MVPEEGVVPAARFAGGARLRRRPALPVGGDTSPHPAGRRASPVRAFGAAGSDVQGRGDPSRSPGVLLSSSGSPVACLNLSSRRTAASRTLMVPEEGVEPSHP